ncbi:hypothetical protein P167DRAFT_169591 [Morchella conica CCBAS932]|uniref:Uncharacterized protein n=1 Tax=Morchella conica CCBAS932 TaxID=1392247 RepID=A0A3N4KV55_9PEZI|nr:hypothetical protein P167DRAFT_169591 [Morchella conica CCBAS932]
MCGGWLLWGHGGDSEPWQSILTNGSPFCLLAKLASSSTSLAFPSGSILSIALIYVGTALPSGCSPKPWGSRVCTLVDLGIRALCTTVDQVTSNYLLYLSYRSWRLYLPRLLNHAHLFSPQMFGPGHRYWNQPKRHCYIYLIK